MSWSSGRKIRWVVVFWSFLVLIPTITVAQSWSYREASNIGYWSWGGTDRFKYDYGATQWWDTTTFGGWQKLGAVGQSTANHAGVSDPNFLGNGSWHTVGTGLSYWYNAGGGYSNWMVNGNMRFAYTYGHWLVGRLFFGGEDMVPPGLCGSLLGLPRRRGMAHGRHWLIIHVHVQRRLQ